MQNQKKPLLAKAWVDRLTLLGLTMLPSIPIDLLVVGLGFWQMALARLLEGVPTYYTGDRYARAIDRLQTRWVRRGPFMKKFVAPWLVFMKFRVTIYAAVLLLAGADLLEVVHGCGFVALTSPLAAPVLAWGLRIVRHLFHVDNGS